jgi:hypothetical protein
MRKLRATAHGHKCFAARATYRRTVSSRWISQLFVVPGRPEEKSTGRDVYWLIFTHRRRHCEVYDCSIVERRLICAVVAAMNGQVKRVSSLSNGAHFLEQEVSASLYNHIRFLLLLYSLSH